MAPAHMETCSHMPFHGTTSRPPNCSTYYSVDGGGANASVADLQARFAAWRPVYTALLRKGLGDQKIIIANVPAPSVADPSLNGVTIEFEHCAGDQAPHTREASAERRARRIRTEAVATWQGAADHSAGAGAGAAIPVGHPLQHSFVGAEQAFKLNDICTATLLGQKALSDLAGRPSVFALWLTHSEVVPAAAQCAELAAVQQALPWILEGDDITDCSREGGPASCVRCNFTATRKFALH